MTQNKILATIAFLLAAAALIVRAPDRNFSSEALASMIENEQDHITPLELARSIIGKSEAFRLIDLRDSASYYRYHIPGAELMTLATLVGGGVHRNENIVLYSQGGTHAAQGWVLLETKNFSRVRTLLGGIEGWNDMILYPKLQTSADEIKQKEFQERKALSLFFGGSPIVSPDSAIVRSKEIPKQKLLPQKKEPIPKLEEDKLRQTC